MHQLSGVETSAQLLRCPKQCMPEAKMFSNKGLVVFKEMTEKRPTKKKREKKACNHKGPKIVHGGEVGENGEPSFNLEVLF